MTSTMTSIKDLEELAILIEDMDSGAHARKFKLDFPIAIESGDSRDFYLVKHGTVLRIRRASLGLSKGGEQDYGGAPAFEGEDQSCMIAAYGMQVLSRHFRSIRGNGLKDRYDLNPSLNSGVQLPVVFKGFFDGTLERVSSRNEIYSLDFVVKCNEVPAFVMYDLTHAMTEKDLLQQISRQDYIGRIKREAIKYASKLRKRS